MHKPRGATAVFVTAVVGFGLTMYLILGVWLSAARHSDHMNDVITQSNERHVFGNVTRIDQSIATSQNAVYNLAIVDYPDFDSDKPRHQKAMIVVTDSPVPVTAVGLNVFRGSDRVEQADSLPGSYEFRWPLFIGLGLGLVGLGVLTVLGFQLAAAWARYHDAVERERRELVERAQLSPWQFDIQQLINRIQAMPASTKVQADKKRDLLRQAQELYNADPELDEIATQLRLIAETRQPKD